MKSCDRLEIINAAHLKINIFSIKDRKQNLENIYREVEKQEIYQILHVINRILDFLCQEIE